MCYDFLVMRIAVGVSGQKNASLAAQEAIRAARTKAQGGIDLCLAFSSPDLASVNLLKTISAGLGEVPVVGISGAGVITDQGILNHGLAVLLLGIPEGITFNTACVYGMKSKADLAGGEMGEKLLLGFSGGFRALGMLLSDSLDEVPQFIHGLQEKLGKNFPLYGASAAEGPVLKSSLYFNREVLNDGCVGLLWGGRLNFGFGMKHGWKPIGKPHLVTKSGGGIAESIDGKEAVMLYQEYLGCSREAFKKDLRHIATLYPLGILVPGEKEYLLRSVLSVLEGGALRLSGDIPEGSSVRLMIATKETCLNAAREAVEEAKRSLFSNPMIGAEFRKEKINKFALVFSSASRRLLLKRESADEVKIIKESLGADTPVLGIYSKGELSTTAAVNYHGQGYYQNQTTAVLLIGS